MAKQDNRTRPRTRAEGETAETGPPVARQDPARRERGTVDRTERDVWGCRDSSVVSEHAMRHYHVCGDFLPARDNIIHAIENDRGSRRLRASGDRQNPSADGAGCNMLRKIRARVELENFHSRVDLEGSPLPAHTPVGAHEAPLRRPQRAATGSGLRFFLASLLTFG